MAFVRVSPRTRCRKLRALQLAAAGVLRTAAKVFGRKTSAKGALSRTLTIAFYWRSLSNHYQYPPSRPEARRSAEAGHAPAVSICACKTGHGHGAEGSERYTVWDYHADNDDMKREADDNMADEGCKHGGENDDCYDDEYDDADAEDAAAEVVVPAGFYP